MDQRGKHIVVMDYIGIAVFSVYLVILSIHVVTIAEFLPISFLLLAGVAGYVLSDFLSGFVHFLGDSFGSETTPILGKAFIEPFRQHHTDPEDITRHGFVQTNGHNCLVSLPTMMILAHVVFHYALNSVVAFAFATSYFLVLGVFLTNQFHKWAHMPSAPKLIRFFQRARLILSPNHHRIHHTAPFRRYYCITTGWLNLILDKIAFFPISKAILSRIPFMLKPAEKYVRE